MTVSRTKAIPFIVALLILLAVYLPTLQTRINGANHYFTADVGELQIVLNKWGTLHSTGYPLYTIGSCALVAILRTLGMDPATAPSFTSLLWGVIALALFYMLLVHVTNRRWESAAVIVLFGLVRTVWVHHVIAEIYTFGLILLLLVLLIALWRGPVRHRIYWLALLGGIGVGHHRAIFMAAPALIYAAWPEIWQHLTGDGGGVPQKFRRGAIFLCVCLLLGLAGVFVPYLYMWLRGVMGADWVYGNPATLPGLWDQFVGAEAGSLVHLPASWEAFRANLSLVNTVILTDLTLPGLLAGLIGLVWAVLVRGDQGDERGQAGGPVDGQVSKPVPTNAIYPYRRAGITLILNAAVPYAFHVLVYTDILSALILPVIVSVAFGWLFLADAIMSAFTRGAAEKVGRSSGGVGRPPIAPTDRRWWLPLAPPLRAAGLLLAAGLLAIGLLRANWGFITELTTDDTGLAFIELAEGAPPGSSLMVARGAYYFAVAYAQAVDPSLAGPGLQEVTLIPHDGGFVDAARDGMLLTPSYTFFNQPPDWWAVRLGTSPVLQAAAPYLIQVMLEPQILDTPPDEFGPVQTAVTCTADAVRLDVTWATPDVPPEDLSVFVHALDEAGNVVGQADQVAPVYGWRPLTGWAAGEAVRDVYEVTVSPAAVDRLRYGFYRVEADGFTNVYEYEAPVVCR